MKREKIQSVTDEPKRVSTGGRPKIEPSEQEREQVLLLRAAGWPVEDIAATMGVHVDSLYAAFPKEMESERRAVLRLEARTLLAAMKEALDSRKPAAIRTFVDLMERQKTRRAEEKFRGKQAAEPKPEKLGKKEIAQRAAAAVANGEGAGEWGSLLKPGEYDA